MRGPPPRGRCSPSSSPVWVRQLLYRLAPSLGLRECVLQPAVLPSDTPAGWRAEDAGATRAGPTRGGCADCVALPVPPSCCNAAWVRNAGGQSSARTAPSPCSRTRCMRPTKGTSPWSSGSRRETADEARPTTMRTRGSRCCERQRVVMRLCETKSAMRSCATDGFGWLAARLLRPPQTSLRFFADPVPTLPPGPRGGGGAGGAGGAKGGGWPGVTWPWRTSAVLYIAASGAPAPVADNSGARQRARPQ